MRNMQGSRANNVPEIFILSSEKYLFSDDAEYARFAGYFGPAELNPGNSEQFHLNFNDIRSSLSSSLLF